MALFSFGTKKEAPTPGSPASGAIPTDQILNMRQQGMSDNQIVQALQKDGFNSQQIFDAMNQADIMGNVGPGPAPQMGGTPQAPMPPGPEMAPPGMPPGQGMPGPAMGAPTGQDTRIEEIAESIIEEKWQELVQNINKIIEWKNSVESKMAELQTQIQQIKSSFDNLHTGVVGKMGDYDKHLGTIGSDVKSMEQVFNKVLPTMTENINELGRISRRMGGGKAKVKKKVKKKEESEEETEGY
ncbi:hypothetical protein ACFL1H_07160 [Nanoarchaeota archaeon]